MLREYYAYRAWDWESGWPSLEKLIALGMEDLIVLAEETRFL